MNRATVVIASKAGRLGNRLFLSAHFMCNALAKGYRLMNPSLAEYAPFFDGSATDPLCAFPERWMEQHVEFAAQCRVFFLNGAAVFGALAARVGLSGIGMIDIRSEDESEEWFYDLCGDEFDGLIKVSRTLFVKGWKFTDFTNILRFREDVCRYFTPIASIRNPVDKLMVAVRASADKVVGVHVRQEDYRTFKDGKYFFQTERYAEWMREIENHYPGQKISFLVCASNPVDQALFHGLNVVMGPGSAVGDLYSLSVCDAIVGPPSTFSMWASYYAGIPLCTLEDEAQQISSEHFINRFVRGE